MTKLKKKTLNLKSQIKKYCIQKLEHKTKTKKNYIYNKQTLTKETQSTSGFIIQLSNLYLFNFNEKFMYSILIIIT